jgi:hypothetical protein
MLKKFLLKRKMCKVFVSRCNFRKSYIRINIADNYLILGKIKIDRVPSWLPFVPRWRIFELFDRHPYETFLFEIRWYQAYKLEKLYKEIVFNKSTRINYVRGLQLSGLDVKDLDD